MTSRDVFIVHGSDPEVPGAARPLAVFLKPLEADEYLLQGLLGIAYGHMASLEPGGQVSLLVTRANRITDEEPRPIMSQGSFSILSGKDRHVWDFHVERAQTKEAER